MAPCVLLTPPPSVSKASASRQVVMGTWAPRRSLTNAACVVETIRAARGSQDFSPSLCKFWTLLGAGKGSKSDAGGGEIRH